MAVRIAASIALPADVLLFVGRFRQPVGVHHGRVRIAVSIDERSQFVPQRLQPGRRRVQCRALLSGPVPRLRQACHHDEQRRANRTGERGRRPASWHWRVRREGVEQLGERKTRVSDSCVGAAFRRPDHDRPALDDVPDGRGADAQQLHQAAANDDRVHQLARLETADACRRDRATMPHSASRR